MPDTLKQQYSAAVSLSVKYSSTRDQSVPFIILTTNRIKILEDAVIAFTSIHAILHSTGYFNSSETIEDLTDHGLSLLTVPHRLAQLISERKSSLKGRFELLQRAKALHEEFLGLCLAYRAILQEDTADIERRLERPSKTTTSHALSREARIKLFQKDRALEQKLNAASLLSDDDDDVVRRRALLSLQLYVSQSAQELDSIQRELAILEDHQDNKERDLRQRKAQKDHDEPRMWKLDSESPIFDRAGKLLRPIVITSKRELLSRETFRPGHSLPTMSIDEYLDLERDRGGILANASLHAPVGRQDVSSEEVREEAERQQAIAWDKFIETHSKGAGNTMNRG